MASLEGWYLLWPWTETCSDLKRNLIPCPGDNDPDTTWGPSTPAVQAQGDKFHEEFVVLLYLGDYAIGNQVQVLKIRELTPPP